MKKIKLSKYDWLKFGKKAGWIFSYAQSVAINGHIYKEGDEVIFNETKYLIMGVEKLSSGNNKISLMDNNMNEKSFEIDTFGFPVGKTAQDFLGIHRKTVISPRFQIPFTEGETKTNHLGKYVILGISDDEKNIHVKYIDGNAAGEEKTHKISDQELILHNMKVREDQKSNLKELNLGEGANKSFTLGYLAANGQIIIMLNEEHVDGFSEVYKRITGDDLAPHYKKDFYTREDGPDYFRIIFPTPPENILNIFALKEDEIVPIPDRSIDSGRYQFNSRNYIMNLFKMGFILGNNKDRINKIKQGVSDQESFEKGFNYNHQENQKKVASIKKLSYFLNNYVPPFNIEKGD